MARQGTANRLHFAVVWVLVTTAETTAAETTIDIGEAACPCTDPLGAQPDGECLKFEAGTCYNNSYGSRCEAWDAGLGPCNVQSPAPWCSSRWCYVDTNSCHRPHRASPFFDQGQTNISGLHYSYATCGDLDSYSDSVHEQVIRGRRLRVSYPGDSLYTLRTVNGEKVGNLPAFMRTVFDDFDITIEALEVSNASKGRFASSYTACVHEVALNRTDLCIGSFWETTQRLQMNPFTTQFDQDLFYLVTFAEEELTLWSLLERPFAPFDWWVWLLVLGVAVLTSAAMYAMEASSEDGPFAGMSILQGIALSAYTAMFSVFSASSAYEIRSRPARFLNISFAFFLLVIITSYTANLTTFLITTELTGRMKSLEEAVKARKKICGMVASQDTLVALVPELIDLWVPVVDWEEIYEAMDEGRCDAAVVSTNAHEGAHRGGYTNDARHCNKILVGDPLVSIGHAMPVRPDLQQSLSWAIARRMADGTFQTARQEAKAKLLQASKCEASEAAQTKSLQLSDMGGTFVLAIFVLAGSLVWYMCEVCVRKAIGQGQNGSAASSGDRDAAGAEQAEEAKVVPDEAKVVPDEAKVVPDEAMQDVPPTSSYAVAL